MKSFFLSVTLLALAAAAGPVDFAKADYARYLRQVTGREAPAAEFRLDTSLDAVHDEYRIVSTNGTVAFVGANGRAVQYAVYDFLARRAGCRWFWDGDVVPRRATVDFAGLDVREKSQFEYRAIRYFAHRGLTRFQAEHWGLEDWKREIDWCLKRRVNCIMPRIGMDDTWQKAYPDVVRYPDPAKPIPEAGKGYDNRSLFWSLEYRGRLRKAFTEYAFARGLMVPTDFGTMTHWYSRTPWDFLNREKPPFIPQASKTYGQPTGLVFDVRDEKWLDTYWNLTDAFVKSGYGSLDLLHTIGLGERLVSTNREENLAFKVDVLKRLFRKAEEKAPGAPILLAGWDFYFRWRPDEVRSLLPLLDSNRVLIWDYEADAVRNWNQTFQTVNANFTDWGVVGRYPYTFGIFLAYEQALDIRANYPLIEARQKAIENDPFCRGYLFWPEASHTDIFALRYFTENAWRTGGKTAEALLPQFCRDRYGAAAARFESIWRKVIPVSLMNEYWGNYASHLTAFLCDLPANNYNSYPMTQMIDRFMTADAAFGELARVEWTDEFARRDSIDLARTLLDRKIEMRRLQMLQAHRDWTKGATAPQLVLDRAEAYLGTVRAMTELLALHTDYSLWESYERLDRIERIVNPAFDRVLVDNAINDYCQSHQYEAAAEWYEKLAADLACAVRAKVAAGDKTPLDREALKKKSQAYHDAMLARPLRDMRPTAPRTIEAFRRILRAGSGN